MHKLFSTIAIGTILSSVAYAQSPEIVAPKDTISVAIGRAQTLKFQQPFDSIAVASQGTAAASAASNTVMTLQGLAEGETILRVLNDGREIYTATVIVTPEPGSIVRVYGTGAADHIRFYCTDRNCGRADKELEGRRELASQTTTYIPGAGSSTTKTFGR